MKARWLGFKLAMGAEDTFLAPEAWLEVAEGWMRSVRVLTPRLDSRGNATGVICSGGYSEGEVTVNICRGMVSHLLSWVQDRNTDRQGKAASVVLDGQAYTGVKVALAEWGIDGTMSPVLLTLQLRGKHGSPCSTSWPTPITMGQLVLANECRMERSAPGGGCMEPFEFEEAYIVIDNGMCENHTNTRMETGIMAAGCIWHDDMQRPVDCDEAISLEFDDGQGHCVNAPHIYLPRIAVEAVETDGDVRGDQFIAFASSDGVTPAVVLV